MSVLALDHLTVPCRDGPAAAQRLAEILGVPWSAAGAAGPFSPVYVSDGLTLDFDPTDQPFEPHHYCFRVSDAEFDAILSRLRDARVPFRSTPHGPMDGQVDTQHGGRIVYWNEPDGHVWEILTASYARAGWTLA